MIRWALTLCLLVCSSGVGPALSAQSKNRADEAARINNEGKRMSDAGNDAANAGDFARARQLFQEARRHFDRAANLDPTQSVPRSNVALMDRMLRLLDEEEKAAREKPKAEAAPPSPGCINDWSSTKLKSLVGWLDCSRPGSVNWEAVVKTLEAWLNTPEYRDSPLPEYRAYYDAAKEALPLARAERDNANKTPASKPIDSRPAAAPAPGVIPLPVVTVPDIAGSHPPASAAGTAPGGPPPPETLRVFAKEEPVRTDRGPRIVIGSASDVRGTVYAIRNGEQVRLENGRPVFRGDRIITDAQSRSQFLLLDETVFTVGPNSEMVLDDFVFDPASQEGRVEANITKGTFRFITGKIANSRPRNFKVKLPVGDLGTRGTDFTATCETIDGTPAVTVEVTSGTVVTFAYDGDIQTVNAGERRIVRSNAVSRPTPWDDAAVAAARRFRDGVYSEVVGLNDAVVMITDHRWVPKRVSSTEVTLADTRGQAIGRFVVDDTPLTLEELRRVAVNNVPAAGTRSALVLDSRVNLLNSTTVSRFDIEFQMAGERYLLAGHYYSGAQGTAQLTVLVPKALAGQVDVEGLLNGLEATVPRQVRR